MKKMCLILSLFALCSSCDGNGSNDQTDLYYDDSQPEGYSGKKYPSGDSYYEDSARNPQRNEPRSNWRLW